MEYDDGMDSNHTHSISKLDEADTKTCDPFPSASQLERLADFYKIMGDQTRLRLLMALEQKEQCVSELSAICEMSLSAVSHQLKALRSAKLVKSRKEGKAVYYSLDDEHIHSVIKVALAHILEDD